MTIHVLSVGFPIPGEAIESVSLNSGRSLLDADIIVFAPNLEPYSVQEYYRGKPSLTENDSAQLPLDLDHWRSEIAIAVEAGKTVFVFMLESQDVYVFTGEKKYAGTGRYSRTTSIVTQLDPYTSVPLSNFAEHIVRKKGDRIAPTRHLGVLATYWQEFGPFSSYQIYLNKPIGAPALVTQTGDRMIGGIIRTKSLKGTLVLLPPPHFPEIVKNRTKQIEKQRRAKESAPSAADSGQNQRLAYKKQAELSVGKQFLSFIIEIDKALRERSETTPTPEWAKRDDYILQEELALRSQMSALETRIVELRGEQNTIESAAIQAATLRGLLFETGKSLETAIIHALQLMGYNAQPFKDNESEFDVLFEDPDGSRYIGEVEGKNDKAVNIDKLAQLERNIQEDFEKRESNEFAKPVLFGNAFRLLSPEERGGYFTLKCLTGAKRAGAALVRTPDLFTIAKYLKENEDSHFGALCRKAIRETVGMIVEFPHPPNRS
jgi:hypothetical protein